MIVVNLSEMPWTAELRRNAAMFRELVRAGRPYHGGIFVAPVGMLPRTASLVDRAVAMRGNLGVTAVMSDGVQLAAYGPQLVLPFSGRRGVARAQLELFRRVLARALRGQPYALWINCVEKETFALAEYLAPRAAHVVVDLSDDWTAFDDLDPAARDARLARAIAMSDALLAVNAHVLAKFPHPAGRVFANATDFDNFQKYDPAFVLGNVLPKRAGDKLVGFSGGLNVGRVDEALVDKLIAELPDATFVFVGYSNSPDLVARITKHANVHVLPAVPFRDLPHVIKAFDVAIVPHAINEHTRGNDLLKVLDYMASGVPIVSTDCSNVGKYGRAIQVADTHDRFVAMVRAVLDGAPHDPAPGLEAARAASWRVQVPELARWLDETLVKR